MKTSHYFVDESIYTPQTYFVFFYDAVLDTQRIVYYFNSKSAARSFAAFFQSVLSSNPGIAKNHKEMLYYNGIYPFNDIPELNDELPF